MRLSNPVHLLPSIYNPLLALPTTEGGLHFSLTLLWSQISLAIAAVLYWQYYEVSGIRIDRRSKLDATTLCVVVGTLVVIWLVSFLKFLRTIKPEYLHTFFGTMTGSQYTIHLFNIGDEEVKIDIFGCNTRLWSSIRGKVREWTLSNWARWVEDKPEWLTEHFVSTVPDDFIPAKMTPSRRRSSFLGSLGIALDAKSGEEEQQRSSKVAAAEDGEK